MFQGTLSFLATGWILCSFVNFGFVFWSAVMDWRDKGTRLFSGINIASICVATITGPIGIGAAMAIAGDIKESESAHMNK
jgi:hypothetical protein